MTGASAKGALIVFTETSPVMEEEFNAWYDTEHIPERAAIPGFVSALRFRSPDRAGHYLAIYDLEAVEVLQTPDYLAFAGDNYTPWTKRIISNVLFRRFEAVQITPGDRPTSPCGEIVVLDFGAPQPGFEPPLPAPFDGVIQARSFLATGTDGAERLMLLLEGETGLTSRFRAFLPDAAAERLRDISTYVAYAA